jgi:hypothetical protein
MYHHEKNDIEIFAWLCKVSQGAPWPNRRHCKDIGRFLGTLIIADIGIMVIDKFSGMPAISMSKWNLVIDENSAFAT